MTVLRNTKSRPVIARSVSDEAIQAFKLDCFASLAMTVYGHTANDVLKQAGLEKKF